MKTYFYDKNFAISLAFIMRFKQLGNGLLRHYTKVTDNLSYKIWGEIFYRSYVHLQRLGLRSLAYCLLLCLSFFEHRSGNVPVKESYAFLI